MSIVNILIGAWMWNNLGRDRFWWTMVGVTLASITDHYFGNQIGHALVLLTKQMLGEATP